MAEFNSRGVWLTKEDHFFDEPLCCAIADMCEGLGVKTIIDIGCGDGSYIKYLNEDFECKGYDGSPLTPEPCKILDFSRPVDVGEFDMVLSLEVGEHIPKKYEIVFIENLCRAAKKWIILSWAVEGQGGRGHVNCRNNSYVMWQLFKNGFEFDLEWTRDLRDASTIPWFKNTIMVFKWNQ